MSAVDVVLTDALQDRSFAGLFAYSSNVPMKVFAGNEPSVPVSVLVDALDAMQAGKAPKAAARNMQYAAAANPSSCHASCMQSMQVCLGAGESQGNCTNAARACAAQCPMP